MQGAPQDEPRDGIQVRCGDLAPEPHRFQGNRPASGEGIEHPGRASSERIANLLSKPRQLGRRFTAPVENAADRLFLLAALALLLDDIARDSSQQVLAAVAPGVVEQRREQHRSTGRERSAGRPDVQGGYVAVANVLLVNGIDRSFLQRKRGLDQSAGRAAFAHRRCSRRAA